MDSSGGSSCDTTLAYTTEAHGTDFGLGWWDSADTFKLSHENDYTSKVCIVCETSCCLD